MLYRKLGSTELRVSTVTFGGWQVGEPQAYGCDDATSLRAVHAALDCGMNFFDTAKWYGEGHSEELLGRALAGRRDAVHIATKVGLHRIDGEGYRDSRPERIRSICDESLRRLRTDYIDLYQIHWPDPLVPFEDSWAAMWDLVRVGKVRYVGVSNYSVDQMRRCLAVGPIHSLQPCYHMLRRGIEREIVPFCVEHQIGIMPYSPLAHGMLTGRYDPLVPPTWPPGDWRIGMPMFEGDGYRQVSGAVQELAAIAAKHGKSMVQLATVWCLHQPGITTVIAGLRTERQVREAAGGAEWQIPEDDMAQIAAILERTPDWYDLGGTDEEGGNNIRPA